MDRRRRKGKSKSINSGIYILEIYAAKPFNVSIKKFSDREFKTGYYYYVGSAQKNLKQRLLRHFKKDKKIHWHIDHITTLETNNLRSLFVIKGAEKDFECEIANYFENKMMLDSSIKNFGNSDSTCSSTHLFYSKKTMNYNHLFSLYQSMVRLIPSAIDTL